MHGCMTRRFCLKAWLGITACCAALESTAWSAQQYELRPSALARNAFEVVSRVRIRGKFHTNSQQPAANGWEMTSQAQYRYRERRVPGIGRQTAAFRALRIYDKAESQVRVGKRTTALRLHPQLKTILASGQRHGVELFNSRHLFRREDLDLLSMPGDSLAVQSLLPPRKVAVGETWQTPSWSLQMLSALETLLDGQLTCELKSVSNGLAHVEFRGAAEGATLGTKATLTFAGHWIFDLQSQFLKELQLTQTEKRPVGSVSPGMEITATVNTEWSLSNQDAALSDAAAAAYPRLPPESMRQLSFVIPDNLRFRHSRDWHVNHRSRDLTILRLVQHGRLVAQCDVQLLPAAQPGQHISETRFASDIQSSLGSRLDRIEKAAGEKTAVDKTVDGPLRFRFVARGRDSGQRFHWFYYLFADRDGRQATLMFTVADSELERFADQDQSIAKSLEFQKASGPRR